MDLARSIQDVTEEIMLRMARHAHDVTGSRRLCMAGGVALNCVANGRILREGPFEELWVQPAAGDAGGAVGVALALWHRYLGQPRLSPERAGSWQASRGSGTNGLPAYADGMQGALLGPAFSAEQIGAWLAERGYPARRVEREALPQAVARLLAEGRVVGLLQGRMEFGPRSLGNRSILGDARSPAMRSLLNLKIKFRESFRPFAPAVPRERVRDWFELDRESPYMLLVSGVTRPGIPAVTHVDNSARVQTVRRDVNPLWYDILKAFEGLTGCPVIVNTSFNVRGEPPVCTPQDAYRCFMRTEMDALVLETFVLEKAGQPPRAALEGQIDGRQQDAAGGQKEE
jgi:carbamoyltransferase